eukprot:2852676-Pyramimonas_sp.AAC.1
MGSGAAEQAHGPGGNQTQHGCRHVSSLLRNKLHNSGTTGRQDLPGHSFERADQKGRRGPNRADRTH